jgi:hypothetical protein
VETDLVRNAFSMSTESTVCMDTRKQQTVSIGYAQATNIFHGYALDYIRSRAEKNESNSWLLIMEIPDGQPQTATIHLQLTTNWLLMLAGPPYIASARTTHKTPLPTAPELLRGRIPPP